MVLMLLAASSLCCDAVDRRGSLDSVGFLDIFSFYRAMHVVLARYCYRKVVRPSVRDVDVRWAYNCWTSSKLITRIISLGSSQLEATTSAI